MGGRGSNNMCLCPHVTRAVGRRPAIPRRNRVVAGVALESVIWIEREIVRTLGWRIRAKVDTAVTSREGNALRVELPCLRCARGWLWHTTASGVPYCRLGIYCAIV